MVRGGWCGSRGGSGLVAVGEITTGWDREIAAITFGLVSEPLTPLLVLSALTAAIASI